jgi:hypothetical protein
MPEDTFPHPISDPEADGLPGVADDDSSAWDDVDTGRSADGPDPAALPLDRDDRPLAVDSFGTTPEEARQGESLDLKLDREVPDPALAVPREPSDAPTSGPETYDPDAIGEELDAPDPTTPLDTGPVDPRLESPVSMYDLDGDSRPVGRLVEPDEGVGPDTERDAIAFDAGGDSGGASAEELAIHPVAER